MCDEGETFLSFFTAEKGEREQGGKSNMFLIVEKDENDEGSRGWKNLFLSISDLIICKFMYDSDIGSAHTYLGTHKFNLFPRFYIFQVLPD